MQEHKLELFPGELPESLNAIPFFESLDEDTLKAIMENTTILECQPGDHVVEEWEDGSSMYFLLQGTLRIVKDGTIIGAARRSGAMLGELALLNQSGTRSATLVVEGAPCYVLRVDQSFLDGLYKDARNAYFASLYRFVADLLAERLERTTEMLAVAQRRLSEFDK